MSRNKPLKVRIEIIVFVKKKKQRIEKNVIGVDQEH